MTDTVGLRKASARALLGVIGVLYVLIGASLTPPYPLVGVVDPVFWRVVFSLAGLTTIVAAAYGHPPPRWLAYLSLILVTFAAGSRMWVLAVSFDWGPPIYAWGIIVGWQLRDWLDICRWR